MVSDLSDERARVVRQLNEAGVPLVGIPLGRLAVGLGGLDIEPDARFYEQIMEDPRRLPGMLLPRLRDTTSRATRSVSA